MAANEPLNQLETTDASNTPAGSDVIGSSLDDELRSIKANIARSAREESTATASAAATLAVTVLNKIVPVSGSAAGSTTITLPAAATAGAGFRFTAWKTDNTNNVIIDANGAETINGGADYTMATQYEAAQFVTDGTSWVVESTAKREIGTSDLADDSVTLAKMEHGTSGDVLYYGASGAPTRLAKGTDGQVLGLASGIPAWQEEAARTPYGFYTTRNATDTANDVDISAGQCWDTTRTVFLQGSAMTKQLDATWAVGTNAGMLDTGAVSASEGYYIYAMISDVDGSVDYLASLQSTWSAVTPKPTNYTKGQIIGFIYRNGTPLISEIVWSGNHCQYLDTGIQSFQDSAVVQQRFETYSINTAPANAVCNWQVFSDDVGGTGETVRIGVRYADGTANFTSSSASYMAYYTQVSLSTVNMFRGTASFDFQINDSQQIMISATEYVATTITAYIRGYWMPYRLEATS